MTSRHKHTGYYETPLAGKLGETYTCVWLPIKEAAPPLGHYKSYVDTEKKLKAMVAMMSEHGMPKWIPTCCLPKVESAIATANPLLGRATSDMVADGVNGIVVYFHGLSDGPPSLAHLWEKLAGEGFICAAPSFTDDDSNKVQSVLSEGYASLEDLHTDHRVERANNCIAYLLATYGSSLPMIFVGYSTGADTIRLMEQACPRIYMAGPGWLAHIAGERFTAPAPAGPTLQLLALPDATMTSMGFDADAAMRLTGHGDATETVAASDVAAAFASGKQHLRVDFPGFLHGSFKHPPFAVSEDNAWKALLCGIDPWAVIGMANAYVEPEVRQQRADAFAEVIASWLLAVVSK